MALQEILKTCHGFREEISSCRGLLRPKKIEKHLRYRLYWSLYHILSFTHQYSFFYFALFLCSLEYWHPKCAVDSKNLNLDIKIWISNFLQKSFLCLKGKYNFGWPWATQCFFGSLAMKPLENLRVLGLGTVQYGESHPIPNEGCNLF